MKIKSCAKINLSLDVGEVMASGMHPVDTIMQKLELADELTVDVCPGEGIKLEMSTSEIPTDERNLAYRAAEIMLEHYKGRDNRQVEIYIEKNIPVEAGLAGGSGNGAAVITALNELWNMDMSEEELCELGKSLGADVPFCIMDSPCGRGRGIGTELTRCKGIRAHVVLAKPGFGVSTKEVYRGIDSCEIGKRPDNERLIEVIERGRYYSSQMINVLEQYTLNAYPEVMELKSIMVENAVDAIKTLMSGSGPTVFTIFNEEDNARALYELLKSKGYDVYITKTKL